MRARGVLAALACWSCWSLAPATAGGAACPVYPPAKQARAEASAPPGARRAEFVLRLRGPDVAAQFARVYARIRTCHRSALFSDDPERQAELYMYPPARPAPPRRIDSPEQLPQGFEPLGVFLADLERPGAVPAFTVLIDPAARIHARIAPFEADARRPPRAFANGLPALPYRQRLARACQSMRLGPGCFNGERIIPIGTGAIENEGTDYFLGRARMEEAVLVFRAPSRLADLIGEDLERWTAKAFGGDGAHEAVRPAYLADETRQLQAPADRSGNTCPAEKSEWKEWLNDHADTALKRYWNSLVADDERWAEPVSDEDSTSPKRWEILTGRRYPNGNDRDDNFLDAALVDTVPIASSAEPEQSERLQFSEQIASRPARSENKGDESDFRNFIDNEKHPLSCRHKNIKCQDDDKTLVLLQQTQIEVGLGATEEGPGHSIFGASLMASDVVIKARSDSQAFSAGVAPRHIRPFFVENAAYMDALRAVEDDIKKNSQIDEDHSDHLLGRFPVASIVYMRKGAEACVRSDANDGSDRLRKALNNSDDPISAVFGKYYRKNVSGLNGMLPAWIVAAPETEPECEYYDNADSDHLESVRCDRQEDTGACNEQKYTSGVSVNDWKIEKKDATPQHYAKPMDGVSKTVFPFKCAGAHCKSLNDPLRIVVAAAAAKGDRPRSDQRLSYAYPSFLAPGSDLLAADLRDYPTRYFGVRCGSSFATPIVTAIAARLIREFGWEEKRRLVKPWLAATVDIPTASEDYVTAGMLFGRVNLERAVESNPKRTSVWTEEQPGNARIHWQGDDSDAVFRICPKTRKDDEEYAGCIGPLHKIMGEIKDAEERTNFRRCNQIIALVRPRHNAGEEEPTGFIPICKLSQDDHVEGMDAYAPGPQQRTLEQIFEKKPDKLNDHELVFTEQGEEERIPLERITHIIFPLDE